MSRFAGGKEGFSLCLPCFAFSKRSSPLLLMDVMQISCRSKRDWGLGKSREIESKMSKTAGRVNTWITDVFCIISPVIKGNSFSSTLGCLFPHWWPWSALWSLGTKWYSGKGNGYFVSVWDQEGWVGWGCGGVDERFLMACISLKPHWFAAGVDHRSRWGHHN